MGRRRSWVRIPPSGRMIGGSSVVERFHVRKMSLVYTSLAQRLEHSLDKRRVVGSNPTVGTYLISGWQRSLSEEPFC